MGERKKIIFGSPSWIVSNGEVEAAVTETGGQMAPVSFHRGAVQPYYINPWREEKVRTGLGLLDTLRGDFFCLPFGAGNRYRGEDHPPHGETANAAWRFVSCETRGGVSELVLTLEVKARAGTVTKRLALAAGQNVVYCRHELAGFSGKMCYSHHATLAVPDAPDSLRLSVSPFRLGMVAPRDDPFNAGSEYYFLAPGATFTSLAKVPSIWKELPYEDCSSYPSRYGFMALAAVYARPGGSPAWAAAAVPSQGYLWFALKDPRALPQTLLWIDNGGRHAAPWSGRNRCLGVEDGLAFFGEGLAASARANELSRQGIPTAANLRPARTAAVNYIQGVARIPKSFDRVKAARFSAGAVTFLSAAGPQVTAPVSWGFLESGAL